MWQQFLLTSFHFAINIFVALVLFSVSWLYYDAWSLKRRNADTWKVIGFACMSFSYLMHAMQVETGDYFNVVRFSELLHQGYLICSIVGSCLVGIGLFSDPIIPRPKHEVSKFAFMMGFFQPILVVLRSEAMLIVTALYYRRHTQGLEKHLARVAVGFFFIFLSSIFETSTLFRLSPSTVIQSLVAPYGVSWIIEHVVLFIGACILQTWVFTYLLKRIASQIFIIGISAAVGLCIVVTMVFSSMIFIQIEQTAVRNLRTNASVLLFSIEHMKSQALNDAQLLALNSQLPELMKAGKEDELFDLITSVLLAREQSDVVVVNKEYRVLSRASDKEQVGESLSEEKNIQGAMRGENLVGFKVTDGIVSPQVFVEAVTPIKIGNEILGVVKIRHNIDAGFLKEIQQSTGLVATIYGHDTISATSLDTIGYVGLQEALYPQIVEAFSRATSYTGKTSVLHTPYISSFVPLKNENDALVGMLSVGQPESSVFSLAGTSIELTFMSVVMVLLIGMYPIRIIARNIEAQFM